MRTLLSLLLGAVTMVGAWGQAPAPATTSDSAVATAAQPSAPVGIIILKAIAGYEAAAVSFVSIQWVSTDGGFVVDSAGAKTSFLNTAIGRIIYFDQAYYEEIDHNQYWIDWRAGLQNREVIVTPPETIRLTSRDLPRLQAKQALLTDIIQRYPAGQPAVQPMIDVLKDDCTKLSSGLILQNGQWISASNEQVAVEVPTTVVGEGNRLVTFTTRNGKTFTNARITVTDHGVSVITDDGGGSVAFDQMPADLSGFPASVRAKIEAAQKRLAAAQAAAAPPVQPATVVATPASPTKSAPPEPPKGIWATIEYYASMAWQKVSSAISGSSSTAPTAGVTNAPAATSAAPPPAPVTAPATAPPPVVPTPPAAPTVATLSSNAVVIIKGDFGEGTGFLARTTSGPVVFTNLHVVAANPNLKILTTSGQEIETTGLKGASDRDLAMFSIVDKGYSYLDLAPRVEDSVNVGDPTVIPGNSEGGEVTLKTNGKVVGIGPQQVEFDNPIYHGNSGGPVFDIKTGQVIAVVTQAMRMDPKNDIDKSSFANANSAIKGPMRYFGFRIDTVPAWQVYDQNLFLSETLFLKNFHELSRALDSFINGVGYGNASSNEEGPPGPDYYLRNAKVTKAAESYKRTLADHDKLTAVQELVWSVGTLVDENLNSVQDIPSFYPYDQPRAKFEVAYRQALKNEVQKIKDYVNSVRSTQGL